MPVYLHVIKKHHRRPAGLHHVQQTKPVKRGTLAAKPRREINREGSGVWETRLCLLLRVLRQGAVVFNDMRVAAHRENKLPVATSCHGIISEGPVITRAVILDRCGPEFPR